MYWHKSSAAGQISAPSFGSSLANHPKRPAFDCNFGAWQNNGKPNLTYKIYFGRPIGFLSTELIRKDTPGVYILHVRGIFFLKSATLRDACIF